MLSSSSVLAAILPMFDNVFPVNYHALKTLKLVSKNVVIDANTIFIGMGLSKWTANLSHIFWAFDWISIEKLHKVSLDLYELRSHCIL